MNILGIDPGINGGLVVLNSLGVQECVKMPSTPMDILSALEKYAQKYNPLTCYIEDVGYGIPNQSSKATATFARHVGNLEMALLACKIPTQRVTPRRWQKGLGLDSRPTEKKVDHKNRIKSFVQRRLVMKRVTLWGADALAIALYGLNKEEK